MIPSLRHAVPLILCVLWASPVPAQAPAALTTGTTSPALRVQPFDPAHTRFGFELRIACPEGYEPADHLVERARKNAKIVITRDPGEAAKDAHVINTDVWASMGQEDEQKQRERAFRGFSVNSALMKKADKSAIFLHCLPAHRGEEVAGDVIDGPQSRVWDEAENRLHIQKAIMAALMGGEKLT